MDTRLIQSQSQRLVLSPQIRQYLRLLQLPIMELAQAVEVEMTENPLLEEKGVPDDETAGTRDAKETETDDRFSDEIRVGESFENLERYKDTLEDVYGYGGTAPDSTSDLQSKRDFRESLLTQPEALSDFLVWQTRFIDFSKHEKKIADEIIGNIDEHGYLRATLADISQNCKVSESEAEKVLETIQEFEPPGVGARTVREALLLQLERKSDSSKLAIKILKDHFPLLEKRDWQQLSKVMNVDLNEIKAAAGVIARLEPRPGRSFYAEEAIAVTPDATVRIKASDDDDTAKFQIDINNEKIPELRISAYYRKLLRKQGLDKKTREFLKEKMQAALNFMKALSQRKSTLREITEQIVKEQPDFFEKGFSHLRPLRLKDIAANLQIHESTVSRALNNKYISTPQGTIPFKSFFSSKLETVGGEAESQKSIMQKIKGIVDQEDPKKPLSDQELLIKLKADGIIIARRTVAKYRDLLKILPSHLRRKK